MADFPSPPQWIRGTAAKIAASTVVYDKGAIITGDDGSIRIGDGVTQLRNLQIAGYGSYAPISNVAATAAAQAQANAAVGLAIVLGA